MHVVFGASGGAGSALVRALAREGRDVRAVSRSGGDLPKGVEDVRADARDPDAVRDACSDASVTYHAVNVPYARWQETLPTVMETLIEGAGASGARLVYVDNLYMYGRPEGPIAEDTPQRPEGAKGRLRVALADTLMAAHRTGRVEAVIARGSDFFGPGAANTVPGMLVFPAVVEGKRAHWLGSLDSPHSLHYTDDFAGALITLGEAPDAAGEVWHVPTGEALTGRAFIERAFAVAGERPKVGVYRRWMLRLLAPFNRDMREVLEVLYQFEVPFVIDGSRFVDAFGPPEQTPLEVALERSLAWQRERG